MFPESKAGRPRKYHVPDAVAASAEMMLAEAKWKTISWRRGTKGKLVCRFAACRVRVAEGHKHRMSDGRVQAMPGTEEVWLVGERRRDCHEFRVWAGIMGKKEIPNVPTQRTFYTE
jgi:hypothetical protein